MPDAYDKAKFRRLERQSQQLHAALESARERLEDAQRERLTAARNIERYEQSAIVSESNYRYEGGRSHMTRGVPEVPQSLRTQLKEAEEEVAELQAERAELSERYQAAKGLVARLGDYLSERGMRRPQAFTSGVVS